MISGYFGIDKYSFNIHFIKSMGYWFNVFVFNKGRL